MNIPLLAQIELLIFPLFLLTGGLFDLLTLRLENKFNLFGFLLFFPTAWLIGIPLDDMLIHLLTGSVFLLLGLIAFAFRFFGGGDGKFIAVVALWLGYEPIASFLLYTGVFGGLLALGILLGGRFLPIIYQPEFFKPMVERKQVPYATAMAIAALCVYPETVIWSILMPS